MPSPRDTFVLLQWSDENTTSEEQVLVDDLQERFVNLTATDKARGADEITITLNNRDLALLDDPRLAERNILLVQWGNNQEMSPVWRVTIKGVTGPINQLQIKGVGTQEMEMIGEEHIKTWENATSAEVAQEIASNFGYTDETMDIENEGLDRRETIIQTNQTDYAFLTQLAEEEDYIFRISGGKFIFHRPKLGELPMMTLTYWQGEDSYFTGPPTITAGTLGIPGRVERRGHSTRERSTVEASASNESDTDRVSQGSVIYVPDPENVQVLQRQERRPSGQQGTGGQGSIGPTSETTEAGAQRQARSQFRRSEREAIKMTLPLRGLSRLTADSTIRLEGLGEKLTGNYFIESVQHSVNSSGAYTCKVEVKRNAVSASASNTASSETRRRESVEAMDREVEEWEAMRDRGEITADEYSRRVRAQQARRQALESNAGDQAGGRVNEQQGSGDSENELVPVYVPDPDNPQETRVQYRRQGRGSDA